MMVAVWIAAGVLAGVVFGLWIGYELGRWWAEERWWKEQYLDWFDRPGRGRIVWAETGAATVDDLLDHYGGRTDDT